MDLYAPAVVSPMKFVPVLGDVKVVADSVLSQNIVFCVVGLIEENTVQYIAKFLSQIT